MSLMNNPTFLITSYLNSSKGDLEVLRKKLFELGVLTKDYPEEGLMLLYHKFDSPVTTELERECRSLVIDRNTLKIKSYSCETPRINKEGMEYLVTHSTGKLLISPCYEGTYLSIFNHQGKWFVSTRRCLNSQDSVFTLENKQVPKSHYEMFEEVLMKAGLANFNEFSQKLNPDYSYNFILIHHENKHMIDYTSKFGKNYGKICLTTVRDSNMNELNIHDDSFDLASTDQTAHIFIPEKLESINDFASYNKNVKYDDPLDSEGLIVRVWDESMNKNHLVKLQNINYQFSTVLGQEKNIFKGLLYLYQNDKLAEYFTQNQQAQTIKKIVNPLNTTESYDTVGTVDAVFKVCTAELFELFKILWSLKDGKHQNMALYELLPKEYKDIMFAIKGLYYKKKAVLHTKEKESLTLQDVKQTHLKYSDIYSYLKTIPIDSFVAFLRMRRLMFNWVKTENTNKVLLEFGTISKSCDKVLVKLCAIFTNKIYPNIMPNDIPPKKLDKVETTN